MLLILCGFQAFALYCTINRTLYKISIVYYTVQFIGHHSINKIGEAKLTESESESELQMVCDSKFSYVVTYSKRSVKW